MFFSKSSKTSPTQLLKYINTDQAMMISLAKRLPTNKKPLQVSNLQGLLKYCDPDGTRTHDSLIKSQVLYRLSYGILLFMIFGIL